MRERKRKTREEREEEKRARRMVALVIIWIVLMVATVVGHSMLPARATEAPPTELERRARRYAAQEYDRVLALGMSEWSAEEAARQMYEAMIKE